MLNCCHISHNTRDYFKFVFFFAYKATTMVNLRNEIIDMINRQAVCSSDFTWPNHISCVYNRLYNANRNFVCLYGDCVSLNSFTCILYCPTGDPGLMSPSGRKGVCFRRLWFNKRWETYKKIRRTLPQLRTLSDIQSGQMLV